VVQERFGLDPFGGAAFVFRGEPMVTPMVRVTLAKRADRIKILIWDRTGMVLVYKRLDGAKFVWLQVQDGVMKMSPAQLSALFEDEEGQKSIRWIDFPTNDWRLVRPERERRPQVAG